MLAPFAGFEAANRFVFQAQKTIFSYDEVARFEWLEFRRRYKLLQVGSSAGNRIVMPGIRKLRFSRYLCSIEVVNFAILMISQSCV